MGTAASPDFIRIGNIIVNVAAVAYAAVGTGGVALHLAALDRQGKGKTVIVRQPRAQEIVDLLMKRVVLDVQA